MSPALYKLRYLDLQLSNPSYQLIYSYPDLLARISWFGDGGDVAQLVKALDGHAADVGLIPWCGKGFFSQSQLSVQTLSRVFIYPCVQSHALTSVCTLKTL